MSQIKITLELLNDLKRKAEAAGGRPWEVQNRRWTMRSPHYHIAVVDDYWQDETELLIAETIGGKGQKVWANANHIAAANPAVVLALINQLDWQTAQHIEEIKNCIDLQKIIDDLKKEIEDLKDRCDC